MPQEKVSEEQMQKLAEVDAVDREMAFEAGFAKCAQDLDLSQAEYEEFYKAGCAKIAELTEANAKAEGEEEETPTKANAEA